MNIPFSYRGIVEGIKDGGSAIAQTFASSFDAIAATWQVDHTPDGVHAQTRFGSVTGPLVTGGTGSPLNVVSAPPGSMYLRTDTPQLWQKTSGTDGSGWQLFTAGGSGGGTNSWALLESKTAAASSTLEFLASITSAYALYTVECLDVLPGTNAVNLLMDVTKDGGATWEATNYWRAGNWVGSGGASGISSTESDTSMFLVGTVKTGAEGVSGAMKLYGFIGTAAAKSIQGRMTFLASNDSHRYQWFSGGWWVGASILNGIRFKFSSGTIASGTIRVYGSN